MARKLATPKRKKMNFMIDVGLAAQLEESCPAGERSDFVNEAIAGAVQKQNGKKAIEMIEQLQKKYDLRLKSGTIVKTLRAIRDGK